jgi:hypothetical protein
MLEYLSNCDTLIFYFYYPRFSYCCWVFFQIFIYFFNMRNLLSYLLLAVIWLVLAWSEPWQRNITPFLKRTFFSQKHLHPQLMSTNNILTADAIAHVKGINSLMDNFESEQNIAATKASYNIKDKGLLDNYRDAVKGTNYSLQWMDVITDWFEKIRNLVQWSDPSMTKLFLILLVVCFLVVTFLPMRFILSLSYFYKFWKGQSWQRRRINNNQEVCRIELAHFLDKNKL